MIARDYAGAADLLRMQRLCAECWRRDGPLVTTHVGDLPWRMYQHLDKLAEVEIRLWLDGDECRAWAWRWAAKRHRDVDFLVHPDAPARDVPDSYRNVMRAPPYRAELDVVVEAPDGRFAAYCLCWLDEDNRVGLYEPVGTHPDFRRRGLGTAACLGGLHRLRAAGATRCVVSPGTGGPAARFYEALGFRTVGRHVPYRRPTGKEPA